MAAWLREQGARSLFAEIHPEHEASMNVARHLGLKPGDEILESGEIRWSEYQLKTGSAAMRVQDAQRAESRVTSP
jgi:RimJ/RimL family protein N-acetyltransferase